MPPPKAINKFKLNTPAINARSTFDGYMRDLFSANRSHCHLCTAESATVAWNQANEKFYAHDPKRRAQAMAEAKSSTSKSALRGILADIERIDRSKPGGKSNRSLNPPAWIRLPDDRNVEFGEVRYASWVEKLQKRNQDKGLTRDNIDTAFAYYLEQMQTSTHSKIATEVRRLRREEKKYWNDRE